MHALVPFYRPITPPFWSSSYAYGSNHSGCLVVRQDYFLGSVLKISASEQLLSEAISLISDNSLIANHIVSNSLIANHIVRKLKHLLIIISPLTLTL